MRELDREIIAQPLTAAAFSPFGQVVEAGVTSTREANQGTAQRSDFAARLRSDRPEARANLAVFRAAARPLPLRIVLLERHPRSSQLFVPMAASRYLVVVAGSLPSGEPDLDAVRAFLCGPRQAVNYDPGVWHHPIAALDQPTDLVMLAWEDGGPQDCEERPLAQPFLVTLPG
jgi:ureidoglycolate lyase